MYKLNKKTLAAAIVAVAISAPALVLADGYVPDQKPMPMPKPVAVASTTCPATNALAAAVDGLIIRPIGLGATIVGAGIFLGTLPFSILSNNVAAAAAALVKGPADFTFRRCLGNFN